MVFHEDIEIFWVDAYLLDVLLKHHIEVGLQEVHVPQALPVDI
jgi:hypothetical protein